MATNNFKYKTGDRVLWLTNPKSKADEGEYDESIWIETSIVAVFETTTTEPPFNNCRYYVADLKGYALKVLNEKHLKPLK